MQSLIFHPFPSPHTTIHTLPIPTPGPGELLIRVSHAASNLKDYAHPTAQNRSLNSGDDMSGVVCAVGVASSTSPSSSSSLAPQQQRRHFRTGDRVAAFHPMNTPHGTYAEYAIAPAYTTVRIPRWMGWEAAATVPLVAFTAAVTVWRRLGFRAPWEMQDQDQDRGNEKGKRNRCPLIVYGAGSALGCLVIQLAKAIGVGPIVAVAGSSQTHVAEFLELGGGDGKTDVLLDYRCGRAMWVNDARQALGSLQVKHAVDCISKNGTWVPLVELVGEGGVVSVNNGAEKYDGSELENSEAKILYTFVGSVHEGAYKPNMPKQPSKEDAQGDVAFAEEFAVCTFNFLRDLYPVVSPIRWAFRNLANQHMRKGVPISRIETMPNIIRAGLVGESARKRSGQTTSLDQN